MSPISLGAERRPFVMADYSNGVIIEVPAECPWRDAETPCDVILHALRPRKTGPLHPLAVCRCHPHDLAFTAYPPGFVPYARRTLCDVPGTREALLADAAPSLVAVAREAAQGVAWPRSAVGGTDRWWPTQTRLLARLGHALGAFGGPFIREIVALALGIPLRLLNRVAEATGFRGRGAALVAVLEGIEGDLERLLLAGALAGCWGAPWRWYPAPPRLAPLVPPHLIDLAKRSTTSGPRAPPPLS